MTEEIRKIMNRIMNLESFLDDVKENPKAFKEGLEEDAKKELLILEKKLNEYRKGLRNDTK